VAEHAQLVLPFYVVADVSYSMTQAKDGVAPIASLNALVPSIKDALDVNPLLRDKVRFALVDFSDDARVQIPLCDLATVDNAAIPQLAARGATSFAAAFETARVQIDSDYRQLKADGHKVHRPAVFFLTDGEPTDDEGAWRQAHAALVDPGFRPHPNIVPFGVAAARRDVLEAIAAPAGQRVFVTDEGTDPAAAIRSMAELLIGSIIASANSISEAGSAGSFVPPDPDEDDVWL
jgi:uncharacterized protein YegL